LKRSRLILVLWLLTAAFCVGLVTNLVPALRGDVPWLPGNSGWRWPYELPRWLWLAPCLGGLAVYSLGALHLARQAENRPGFPTRLILWAFVGSALLPFLLAALEQSPLYLFFTRSASTVTGGYQFAANMFTDLNGALRDWPGLVERFRKETLIYGGVGVDPPGLVVLYHGVREALRLAPPLADSLDALLRPLQCQNLGMMNWTEPGMASAWFQMPMPLWVGLGVAPLYRLGAAIFDRRTARWAVALWPLVPGLALFMPRFNAFYVLLTLVMLAALWRGLERRRLAWVLLAGFVLSVGTFLNLSLVPLGLLAGLTILGYWLLIDGSFRRPITVLRTLTAFGAGVASVWLVYGALSGVTVFDILRLSLDIHLQIHNRPYLPWLVMHTYDMFLFVGLPLSGLAIWRVLQIRRPAGRTDLFTGAIALTMVIMVLSGTARGETGRVWLFFAPAWLLLAADALGRLRQNERVGALAMQALCLVCMAAVLRVHFTALTVPASVPAASKPPDIAVNTPFQRGEDRLTLIGLDAEHSAQDITLRLYWRADGFVKRPYVLSMIPVRPDRSLLPSLNWDPLNWDYPPSCWAPGRVFVDTVVVPLGDKAMPGDWMFSLSITDVFTHEPMLVNGGQPQVGIGPVNVPAR
jgi:hypothetical protein